MGISRAEMRGLLPEIEAYSELAGWFDEPVRTYSSGMLARLGFSVAIHVDADLLLIDEVHALVDESRGPTLEAVIARMRTVSQAEQVHSAGLPIAKMRVLAASATMSNVEDVAAWLGPGASSRFEPRARLALYEPWPPRG